MKSKKIIPVAPSAFTAGVLSIDSTPVMSIPSLVTAILAQAVAAVQIIVKDAVVEVYEAGAVIFENVTPFAVFQPMDATKKSGRWLNGVDYGRTGATNALKDILLPQFPVFSLAGILSAIFNISDADKATITNGFGWQIFVDQNAGVVQVLDAGSSPTVTGAPLATFTLSDEITPVTAGPARLAFE